MDLSPRAVIAGRYRVDTKVGAGGMGEVWAGEHVGIGVRVAIKTLLPAAALNNEVVARFKREAMFLGRIRSDHVARVVDFIADDDYGLVLVMEYVEGEPLSRMLQERSLSVEETIELGVDIAAALKDLHHANIIHRDLKPGNIIMAPTSDGRRRAIVVDFGVSRLMSDKSKDEDEELTGITRADMAVGTIEYMAPEQILNSRNVVPGSDIYAAGAILFRAAAGRHIFGNVQSDAELAQKKLTTESPALPLTRTDKAAEGLARVVAKMLKRRPSERYKTADDVLADLVPVRDMARGAVAEMESTTIDAGKGIAMMAAQNAGAAASAAAPAAAATPAPAAQPTPVSVPRVTDSSVNVAAPPVAPAAPAKRGVPPVVTFGLVAVALGGGIFLGPRLMAPAAPPAPAAPIADRAPTAEPAQTATAAAASATATATAEAAPSASASAAPSASASATAAASASASAAPSGTPAAGSTASAAPQGAAPKATAAPKPTAAPTAAPATPPKAEPTGI